MHSPRRHHKLHASNLMPRNETELQILHERAKQLAMLKVETVKHVAGVAYVRFKLGENETYGIPYEFVKEVMRNVLITPLPRSRQFIKGIINRHGALIAILDLKQFFTLQSVETKTAKAQVIVVTTKGITLGILADNIEDSDTYEPVNLATGLPSLSAIKTEYVIGLHRGVIAIINIEAIMKDPQLLQA